MSKPKCPTYKQAAIEFAGVLIDIYQNAEHCTSCAGDMKMTANRVMYSDWNGVHTNPDCVGYWAQQILEKSQKGESK